LKYRWYYVIKADNTTSMSWIAMGLRVNGCTAIQGDLASPAAELPELPLLSQQTNMELQPPSQQQRSRGIYEEIEAHEEWWIQQRQESSECSAPQQDQ
jgi:hypothetical protein